MRWLFRWVQTRVSRAVLGVAVDFDERLEACEVLLQRLNEQTKRSRLRTMREPQLSNDEILAAAGLAPGSGQMTPTDEQLPSHVRVRRQALRRH